MVEPGQTPSASWDAVEALLIQDAFDADSPEALLARMSRIAALERLSQFALQATADAAREQGATWQEIGDAVGTSRQNAGKRWGKQRAADRLVLTDDESETDG